MTKIRFYLKHPEHNNSGIYMVVHYGTFMMVGKRKKYLPLKYSIGETICPAHWNKRTCKAREHKMYPQYTLLNERLRIIESVIHSLFLQLKNNGTHPPPAQLRQMMDDALEKKNGLKWVNNNGHFFFIYRRVYRRSYADSFCWYHHAV